MSLTEVSLLCTHSLGISIRDANLAYTYLVLTTAASVYKLQPERARAEAEAAHRAAEAQRRAEEERRQADMEKQEREELRQKRRDKRERVVAEIVQTERDYLQSLSLLLDVCLRPDAPKVDPSNTFGRLVFIFYKFEVGYT